MLRVRFGSGPNRRETIRKKSLRPGEAIVKPRGAEVLLGQGATVGDVAMCLGVTEARRLKHAAVRISMDGRGR